MNNINSPEVYFITLFTASLILCALLVHLSRFAAIHLKALSPVDFRRKQPAQIPLLGGTGIFLTLLCSSLIFNLPFGALLSLCALPIIVVGVWDDIRELKAKPKFAAQILSAVLIVSLVPKDQLFLTQLNFPILIASAISVIWIVGIANAINFIDGIDGQTGMFALIASTALFVCDSNSAHKGVYVIFSAASLGFLLFNLPPAKIYLGDIGSNFIGFTLGALSAYYQPQNNTGFEVLIPFFIFSFPLTDVILSSIRRLRNKRNIFEGDKDHIHHKLQKIGFSRGASLVISSSVVSLCCFTAVTLHIIGTPMGFISISIISTVSLIAILAMVYRLEFILGHQVSRYSQTILKKHIKFDNQVPIDVKNNRVILFDLLPYYKELQQRGLPKVHNFIQEFAFYINKLKGSGYLKMSGSYSVIVAENNKQKWTAEEIINIQTSFYHLLEKHDIKINDSKAPDGLYFCGSATKNQHLHLILETEPRSVNKVA